MVKMEGNFSKVVKSLLLDIDLYLDQLVQIGYYTEEQREFLDKFLYKSEDALLAASLARSPDNYRGCSSLVPKLPWQEKVSQGLTSLPSKSENMVDNATSRARRLRIVTEPMKAEENGLTNFLKRCNARNFTVQVRGSEVAKEFNGEGKTPDHVSTLETIAESAMKASETKADDGEFSEQVSHDTDVILHSAKSLTSSTDVESTGSEVTMLTDATIDICLDKSKPDKTEAGNANLANAMSRGIRMATVEPTSLKPIKVSPPKVIPPKVEPPKSELTNGGPVSTCLTNNHEQSKRDSKVDESTAPQALSAQNTNSLKLNAWGKPVRTDPTRNRDGDIVGGSAKPIGADNRGRVMLEKMGWSQGTGLGKQKDGILEPISHRVKNTKTGLRSIGEREHKLHSSSSVPENTPGSTLVESQASHQENLHEVTTVKKVDWDKSTELTAEQIRATAIWADVERVRQAELVKEKAKPKPQSSGIKALFLREGEGSAEKTIKFNTRIQSTNEYKFTRHYPGVVVKALSAQGSDYSKRLDDKDFKVSTGNHLEILRVHSGNTYHVYSFSKKMRGIVKISLVEMMEEPETQEPEENLWAGDAATIAA